MFKDLVYSTRSFRRFYGDVKIKREELLSLIGLARMTASTSNSQALRFKPVVNEKECETLFNSLGWAGALPDWDGPEKGERPTAYIIVLCDKERGTNKFTDVGITSQTIMLGATEMGYGGCMLGNIRRSDIARDFGIDTEKFTVELVLALGKPKEEVKIVPMPESGDVRYYRDENMTHYVPKRNIEDILL